MTLYEENVKLIKILFVLILRKKIASSYDNKRST